MSALALAFFLLLFYLLPIVPPVPYEWVWKHAPDHFPRLVVHYPGQHSHGPTIWNGAFYLEMWLWWMFCLGLTMLFEWWAKHDDPEWTGLAGGFQRHSTLLGVDIILLILFTGVIYYCASNGLPIHGPISAGVATLSLLFAGPVISALKKLKAEPVPLSAEARALKEEEPPGVSFQKLAQQTMRAVAPGAATGMVFCEYSFTPPAPPDPRLPRDGPQHVAFHFAQADYLAEVTRERPADATAMAGVIASSGESPVIRRVAQLLDSPDAEPRYRVRKVLDLVNTLEDRPSSDGHLRLPLEALQDHAAGPSEKAWLAAALLHGAGFRSALWRESGSGEYGLAVADLYDPTGYLSGVPLRDPAAHTLWLLCHPSGSEPDPNRVQIYEILPSSRAG